MVLSSNCRGSDPHNIFATHFASLDPFVKKFFSVPKAGPSFRLISRLGPHSDLPRAELIFFSGVSFDYQWLLLSSSLFFPVAELRDFIRCFSPPKGKQPILE